MIGTSLLSKRLSFGSALVRLLSAVSKYGFGSLLMAFALLSPMYAQTDRATIFGTVTDATGAAVPGVALSITKVATNAVFSTVTNDTGFYSAPGLPVGTYQVRAELPGFKRAVRDGITLKVDQRAQVNLALEVGELTESVEVISEAPLTDTASATIGKVVDNRRIVDLPLNGRNTMALMLFTPNVRSTAGPTNSGFADRGIQISSVSINGGPSSMNAALLDGNNNIQSYIGEVNISPAVDSVEEFKVQSGPMSAEFGFTAGGVINMVTRSGTNSLRGSAYYFIRHDKLEARNAFAEDKAPFRFHQLGASAGGPISRDKTFYFGNWEEFRYRKSALKIGTFPTPQQREGDFSDLRDAKGKLIPIFDPATTRPNPNGKGFVRDPFPNNLIPKNRLDPVALKINEFYPLPNRTPDNPFTNQNNFKNFGEENRLMRQFTIKMDHRLLENNRVSGRLSFFQHKTDGGASLGSPALIYPDPVISKRDDNMRNKNFVLSNTHTFSPTLINEARVGLTRQFFTFRVRSTSGDWPRKLGLPDIVPPDTFPRINNGLTGFNTGTTGTRASTTWMFSDMLTKIQGKHIVKFGIEYRLNQANNFQRSDPSGNFSFSSALTGNPQSPSGTGSGYATFLLGAVSSASVTTHLGQSQEGYSLTFFIQDDWKLARRLTLNLGLRWDYQRQPQERHDGISNFDPFGTNPDIGLPGRTVFAGVDGQPRSFRNGEFNDFGPRIGFAYDLFGNTKTVLRGGYAIFYPLLFIREGFGNTAGFATTSTSYLPPGGNSNFPAFQLKDGFPLPPIQPLGAKLGPSAFLGASASWDEADGTTPMSQQWDLSLQQALPAGWVIDAAYSGNRGSHLVGGSYDFNQLDPEFLSLGLALQGRVPNPFASKVPGSLGASNITRAQSLRPFPYYNNVTVRFPRLGNSIYHAFVFSAEKRMSQGLAVLFSFTGAKLISDSVKAAVDFGPVEQTNVIGYQNEKFNRAAERAVDPTDVAKRAVVSILYELPFGAGKRWGSANSFIDGLIGGWQINSIGVMQTGLPLIVRGASNFLADRPNSTGQSAKLKEPTAELWFDTTQFVNPPPFTYGNVGRTLPDVRTPGTINWDLSLIKNTALSEDVALQFRAEAFNFPNHVDLEAPDSRFVPGADGKNRSATFGKVRGARDARVIQFGLKLVF